MCTQRVVGVRFGLSIILVNNGHFCEDIAPTASIDGVSEDNAWENQWVMMGQINSEELISEFWSLKTHSSNSILIIERAYRLLNLSFFTRVSGNWR